MTDDAKRDEAFSAWVEEIGQARGQTVAARFVGGSDAKMAWDTAWAVRDQEVRDLWEAVRAPETGSARAILSVLAASFRERAKVALAAYEDMKAKGHTETWAYHQGQAETFNAVVYQLEQVLGKFGAGKRAAEDKND